MKLGDLLLIVIGGIIYIIWAIRSIKDMRDFPSRAYDTRTILWIIFTTICIGSLSAVYGTKLYHYLNQFII
jgi:heme/copper-type cytochrome/quinol oxidase subunit 2